MSGEMSLNKLRDQVHALAVEKGWWDKPVSFGDCIANIHAELSEAWEEYRAGNRIMPGNPTPMLYFSGDEHLATKRTPRCEKPEGIAVEMADAIIRILDWCGAMNVDIEAIIRAKHEFNKTRPYRHGGKEA